ncbi:MAG: hypothetical protein GY854_18275 [Deltaproteobacteria bacterium]|nr:hypothetical protein [Deltaproteobacteria bacterium]
MKYFHVWFFVLLVTGCYQKTPAKTESDAEPPSYRDSASGDDEVATDTEQFSDGGEDTSTPEDDLCPEITTKHCPRGYDISKELISASAIDQSARFVDMVTGNITAYGDQADTASYLPGAILGEHERGGATTPFLVVGRFFEYPSSLSHFTVSYPAQGTEAYAAISLTREGGEYKYEPGCYIALLCSDSECFLARSLSSPDASDDLVPIPNGVVPLPGTPRALLARGDDIWVAGNGIARFDGQSWNVEIAPHSGGFLNALDALEEEYLGAAGDNGRILVRDNSGWRELASGADEDLLDVRLDNQEDQHALAAVGRRGILVTASSLGSVEASPCTIFHATISSIQRRPLEPGGSMIRCGAADGAILSQPKVGDYSFCISRSFPGEILKIGHDYCGIVSNHSFLTENGFWAMVACDAG